MPQFIADAPDGRGGSWSNAGFILFAPSYAGGVFRVPDYGGPPELILAPEAPKYSAYRYPQLLPDGRHVILFANYGTEPAAILLGSLDGAAPKRLALADIAGAFAPPDYVLRVNQGVLEARRLDLVKGSLGNPTPIAQQVGIDTTVLRAAVSVSSTGVLAHRLTRAATRQLFWVDRDGNSVPVGEPNEDNQLHPALAPDGVHVAIQRASAGAPHTFLIDGRPKETPARLMDDPLPEGRPVWSPDGRSVVVNHARQGVGLTIKSLSDPTERVLFTSPQAVSPVDWSTDGQFILFGRADVKTGWDLWGVRADEPSTRFPVVQASADQAHGMFSPNMQWVVYDSNESGRYEVYVQPFRRPGGKTPPVSAGGGMFPRWRSDGKEIFYVAPDGTMMSVAIRESANGETLERSDPVPLFKVKITGGGAPLLGGTYQYSVARDGKRFLVNVTTDEATASPITVVHNWPEVLKQRVPPK